MTFEILYDSECLSAEAFEMWQNSEGPKESQPGKGKNLINQQHLGTLSLTHSRFVLAGVAVASTRQFFTKLAEDKDDDDPDYYGDEGEAS